MKTRNFNQTAKATIASLVILFASLHIASAATAKNTNESIKIATERLDMYNAEMERTVKFIAPAVEDVNMEVANATCELDAFFAGEYANNIYAAPVEKENLTDLEVSETVQHLDSLSASLEQSISYRAE